jgi:hypothetical protein
VASPGAWRRGEGFSGLDGRTLSEVAKEVSGRSQVRSGRFGYSAAGHAVAACHRGPAPAALSCWASDAKVRAGQHTLGKPSARQVIETHQARKQLRGCPHLPGQSANVVYLSPKTRCLSRLYLHALASATEHEQPVPHFGSERQYQALLSGGEVQVQRRRRGFVWRRVVSRRSRRRSFIVGRFPALAGRRQSASLPVFLRCRTSLLNARS